MECHAIERRGMKVTTGRAGSCLFLSLRLAVYSLMTRLHFTIQFELAIIIIIFQRFLSHNFKTTIERKI